MTSIAGGSTKRIILFAPNFPREMSGSRPASTKNILAMRFFPPCTSAVMRFTSWALPRRLRVHRLDREHQQVCMRASRGFGKIWSAAAAPSGSISTQFCGTLSPKLPADHVRDLLPRDQQGAALFDPHGCRRGYL